MGIQAVGKRAKVRGESQNERTIGTQTDDRRIAGADAGVSRRAEREECGVRGWRSGDGSVLGIFHAKSILSRAPAGDEREDGAQLRKSISTSTPVQRRLIAAYRNTSTSTTTNVPIRHWITRHLHRSTV